MTSRDADPPSDRHATGTASDYSEDLYRFYLETADLSELPEQILRCFLGPRHAERLRRAPQGFEFVAPIQCAPDIVRQLTLENVAVYQLVRHEKVDGQWR
jgi:hypothetical protein